MFRHGAYSALCCRHCSSFFSLPNRCMRSRECLKSAGSVVSLSNGVRKLASTVNHCSQTTERSITLSKEWRTAMRVMIIFVLTLFASNSLANDEILIFKHGVDFNHKSHQTERVGKCTVCHDEQMWKIEGFGKEWAHKNCILCHELNNQGRPGNCGGCHKTLGSLKLRD